MQLSECGTFIVGAPNFVLMPVPWYPFADPVGFEALKKYVKLAYSAQALDPLGEQNQWKFLTETLRLGRFLLNRTSPYTVGIVPEYHKLLPHLTSFSQLTPPALFDQPQQHQQNLLSKKFIQQEVTQDELDRDSRHITLHGITRSQHRINQMIRKAGKAGDQSEVLERDERFTLAAPYFSIPGDKRSLRQVDVKDFRELIYLFAGIEKPEKDLPNTTYKLLKKWTHLTSQKAFSEKQRLIISHSFGVSYTFAVMLLQIVKKVDALVTKSGSGLKNDPEYEKLLAASGYISHLSQSLEKFHQQMFSPATWNSFSGAQKVKIVQTFYRTFSVVTSSTPVPFSDDTLLNFAPIEVVKQWQPLFADYKKRKLEHLKANQVSRENELLANRNSFKPPPVKNNRQTSRAPWNGWKKKRGRGRGRGDRGRNGKNNRKGKNWWKKKRGRGRGADKNNGQPRPDKRKANDDPNPTGKKGKKT